MAWTFRLDGLWGAGKGSRLSKAEFDGNTYEAKSRIEALEAALPDSDNGISDFVVQGSQLLIVLEDGRTKGPYTLPIAAFTDRGVYTPGETYFPLDLFSVPSDGLYLARQEFEAASSFDPEEETSDGLLARRIVPVPSPARTVTVSTTTFTPSASQANCYFRCTHVSGCNVTLPDDWPINAEGIFRQCTAGPITLDFASDVTVNKRAAFAYATGEQGAEFAVKYVGAAEWDVFGNLAAL